MSGIVAMSIRAFFDTVRPELNRFGFAIGVAHAKRAEMRRAEEPAMSGLLFFGVDRPTLWK